MCGGEEDEDIYGYVCGRGFAAREREREPFETERYKSTTKERPSAILSVFL
jgi:hypothetical protein